MDGTSALIVAQGWCDMTEGEYIALANSNGGCWLTDQQIVRCMNCKYLEIVDLSSHFDGNHKHDQQQCNRLHGLDCSTMMVELDGFCSWGVRRDDA